MRARALFFDGGCRPNPGPMEAAVVYRGEVRLFDDLGSGDNNEAEWLGLIHAARIARQAGLSDVQFVGDSVLIVEQASGRWRCRSAHLLPYLEQFRDLAAGFTRVRVRQVPRSRNLAGIALAQRDRR